MSEQKKISARLLGPRAEGAQQGEAAGRVAQLLKLWGYAYPLDIERPPLGIQAYTLREHVVVPPARKPADAPEDAGEATPPGAVTRAQVFTAPPHGIVVISGICPAPKNRTAVEFGYVEYRGCIETDGRNLFCSPGTGNTSRLGTQQGVGNIIILPLATLKVELWNADRCSEGKWSLKSTAWALTK